MPGIAIAPITTAMTSQQRLDATLTAQQLILDFLNNTLADHTNVDARARLYGGRIATGIQGTRFSLAAAGGGVDRYRLQDGVVGADERPASSVSMRALRTDFQDPGGVRLWLSEVTRRGILRGEGDLTIGNGSSSQQDSLDWTSAVPPFLAEAMPAGWTAPRTEITVLVFPWYNSGTHWVTTTRKANLRIVSQSSTGFTVEAIDRDSATGALYTTGVRNFYYVWIAFMRHA